MLILRSRQEAIDPLSSSAHVIPCLVSLPVFPGAGQNEDWPSRSHCRSRSDPSMGSEQVNGRRRGSAPICLSAGESGPDNYTQRCHDSIKESKVSTRSIYEFDVDQFHSQNVVQLFRTTMFSMIRMHGIEAT